MECRTGRPPCRPQKAGLCAGPQKAASVPARCPRSPPRPGLRQGLEKGRRAIVAAAARPAASRRCSTSSARRGSTAARWPCWRGGGVREPRPRAPRGAVGAQAPGPPSGRHAAAARRAGAAGALFAPLDAARPVAGLPRDRPLAARHPLEAVRDQPARAGLPDARTVAALPNGRRVRYAGAVICRSARHRPGTSS